MPSLDEIFYFSIGSFTAYMIYSSFNELNNYIVPKKSKEDLEEESNYPEQIDACTQTEDKDYSFSDIRLDDIFEMKCLNKNDLEPVREEPEINYKKLFSKLT